MSVHFARLRAPLLRRPGLWESATSLHRLQPERCCRQLSALCVAIALLPQTAAVAVALPAPSYYELLHQAEAIAPRLLESHAEVGVARGLADQASAWPNPTGSILFENFAGGQTALTGLSTQQTTLSLSQPIEWGGKRSARIAAGAAEVSAAQARDEQALAAFGYDLALAYAGAETAKAKVGLYQEAAQAAAEDVRGTQALVDAGREAGIRAKQANAAYLAAQSDLEGALAEADQSLARLSALVAAPQSFTDITPSLLPLVVSLKRPSIAAPKIFPAVTIAEAERDAALGKLDYENNRVIPDVTATLGVRRLQGEHATVLVGGMSLPIPLFDQNSGNISAAGSQVAAAGARLAAARADAETGWRAAILQANASVSRLSAAWSAAAAAQEAYDLTRIGYQSGKTSLLDLLNARRTLTDARLRLLDAQVARIAAEALLARLAGKTPFGDMP
ncbi:MAG TPA: TolC family protein [Rhizomicrobium sp.]|nr:TolC family protein [Rhizomicrobium sp.]